MDQYLEGIMRIVILLALAFVLPAQAEVPNPIPNPSFEDWSDGVPSGYEARLNGNCPGGVPTYQAEGYLGATSLGLQGDLGMECGDIDLIACFEKDLPDYDCYLPVEGFYGTVVIYYRGQDFGSGFRFRIHFSDVSDGPDIAIGGGSTDFPDATEWTRIEIPLEPEESGTPNQAFFRFSYDNDHGAGSWLEIDNLFFTGAVVDPMVDEHWISSEIDTIRWSPSGWSRYDIRCVLDEGTPNERVHEIGENIHIVHENEYEWEIPDSLLSHHSRIIVENHSAPGETMESDLFKLKGYTLAKWIEPQETYEPFVRAEDAWGFVNADHNLWPWDWYRPRFFYLDATDPYTGKPYDDTFFSKLSSTYPSWPDFVDAFGTGQCYWDVPGYGLAYREHSVEYWKGVSGLYRGSCFGMAISTLMSFDPPEQFLARYPDVPPHEHLSDFPEPLSEQDASFLRPIIHSIFSHQFGQPHKDYISLALNTITPTQTVEAVKQHFLADEVSHRILALVDGADARGHVIVPYKLVERPEPNNDKYILYVYDNSYPADHLAAILIDTTTNGGNGSWTYANGAWAGSMGLFLMDETSSYFTAPEIPGLWFNLRDTGQTQLLATSQAELLITDAGGLTTGFVGGQIHNDIPGADPLIACLPDLEGGPYGYNLPAGEYALEMSAYTDSISEAVFFEDSTLHAYSRLFPQAGESDRLELTSDGLVTFPHHLSQLGS